MLKREKFFKYFVQDCLKIVLLVCSSLKMHGNSKNDYFLIKKNLNLFLNTALLQLEQLLVPNLY